MQGDYVSPRVINLMLRYLTHAIELNPTWKLIKPHIHDLLTKCVFDLMCFTDEDAELWEFDPQEYIRKVSSCLALCTPLLPVQSKCMKSPLSIYLA